MEKVFACIDLKSFYASVECVSRGLDPLKTNLAVADKKRTEKTICLAISPSLKKYGISGRARLFELTAMIQTINRKRKIANNNKPFIGKSYLEDELATNKNLALDVIIAPPRMATYMKVSSKIVSIYLKHLAKEDIFVYSIDEIFCDITKYLKYKKKTKEEFIIEILKDVYDETHITATAGLGPNPFLAKVAMDIVAKHEEANEFGVRMAYLDEKSFKEKIWPHNPITDIWRIGKGYAKRLKEFNMNTLGDVARCSLENEDLLYKLFGVNAEILIDHAWAEEPCTIKEMREYKPKAKSIGTSQVLQHPYTYEKAKLIVKEMAEKLSLDLTKKNLLTKKIVLTIGYDIENIKTGYQGEIKIDHYGRKIPKHSHGTITLNSYSQETSEIMHKTILLFEKIVNKQLLIRRLSISAIDIITNKEEKITQLSLFEKQEEKEAKKEKTQALQDALLNIKNKYGKNAILKGMNLEKGATMIERNKQIGGHHE